MNARTRPDTAASSFMLGGMRVIPSRHTIERGGKSVRVEAKTMDLLLVLAENPGRVVSREALVERLWPGVVVGYEALTQAMAKLRRALGDDARNARAIETVAKSGYRLLLEVRTCPESSAAEGEGAGKPALPKRWTSGRVALLAGVLCLAAIAVLFRPPGAADPAAGAAAENGPSPESAERRPRLLVTPLRNLSGSKDQDYFADGLTEELITRLSQDPRFFVLGRSTSFAFKDPAAQWDELRKDLRVNYLLEGGVERAGERLRINVRVVEAKFGKTIWAEQIDGPFEDLFAMRDRAVDRITETVGQTWGAIKLSEIERVQQVDPKNVHAYDWFLKAHAHFYAYSRDGNARAREIAEEGLRQFPDSALLHAKIAWTHYMDGAFGWSADREQSMRRALDYARRGLAQPDASTLGQMYAHWASGKLIMWVEKDIDRSLAAYEKALQLDPYSADLNASAVEVLAWAGRADEAIERGRLAIERNPRGPAWYQLWYGFAHYVAGHYDEACRVLTAIDKPDWANRARWLAASHAAAGRADEARRQVAELRRIDPQESLSRLRKTLPYRDKALMERELGHLRLAGLPE